MPTILVVDDSSVDRQWAGTLLEQRSEVRVTYAEHGQAALESLEKELPDLVLTDLQMPHLNGLQLVERIRARHPLVPVVLMTAFGSEDIAMQALRMGAASYVPKRRLADDLGEAVENILSLTRVVQEEQRVLECLTQTESRFVLDNDLSLVPALIGHLEKGLRRMNLCDATGLIRVAVALHEVLVNAIGHGNLQVSSQLREGDGNAYHELMKARRYQEPYCSRRVHLTALESRTEVVYVIRDEGPGFDPSTLPDPTDPANLEKPSGRGLLLVRTFMDQVSYQNGGREITMILRKDRKRQVTSS